MTKVTKKPSTILYPVPAVLVSCGVGEQANIITLAWVGTLCSNPPLVGISVRPNRYSHGLIQEAGEFVVNLPTAEQARWVDYCGVVSGRDENKWAACGFSQAPATELQTPLIAECPVNIECRLQQTISLGSHDLFIGEVVTVQMDEAVLNERGVFDPVKAEPLAYVAGEYWQFSKFLGRHGYSKQG